MDPFAGLNGFPDLNVEDLQEKLRGRMDELTAVQRKMREMSASAASPQRLLTVTVGPQGETTGVTFHSDGYRKMARPELEHLILETTRSARAKVMTQMRELMTPMAPSGVDMDALLEGRLVPGDLLGHVFSPRTEAPSPHPDEDDD
ncbi:YbaB/EbfC family nucleoid-associated protein [Streptomyces sp. BBFR2]|uniref:YbaB/EbfC family nucleoid-associated protein n=1 Tax=Streptomyces sp. BBFR2 TaxID=3372854 RepID=UPI0037DA5758